MKKNNYFFVQCFRYFNLIFPYYIFIILFVSFGGCESSEFSESKVYHGEPISDLSTPDKSVESYFHYLIWADSNQSIRGLRLLKENYNNGFYAPILAKNLRDSIYKKEESFYKKRNIRKYQIDLVDIQSDTRAVVLVSEGSEELIKYKYTLTKTDEKWYINNIEKNCYLCDGTGKIRDYTYYYNEVYKECTECKGGMRSIFKEYYN